MEKGHPMWSNGVRTGEPDGYKWVVGDIPEFRSEGMVPQSQTLASEPDSASEPVSASLCQHPDSGQRPSLG